MTYTSELEIMNQSKFEVLHHTQLKFIQCFTKIACNSVHFLAYMHDDDDDGDNDNDSEGHGITFTVMPIQLL